MKSRSGLFAVALFIFTFSNNTNAQPGVTANSPIQIGTDGKLSYNAQANGDRVPDFSYCGYMLSEVPIPDVAVKVIVPAMEGDATAKIQSAIDYVSSLPLNQGFRGAVLLEKGTFEIAGGLTIRASGVVLRGCGSNNDGTRLIGTGVDRETLIKITGIDNRVNGKSVQLADTYFPVNSTKLTFKNTHPFTVGDLVIVNRPSTKEWLEKLGTDKIGIYVDYDLTKWEPGDFDQNWYRKVIAVTPESITIDIPLTNSLDPKYGGGNVAKYTWAGQIRDVGVENIKCISSFDQTNKKDENHRWMAITMENVIDSWVRRVVAEHFVSSAVAVWETASRITVEDCKSLALVGEVGNHRRYSFHTVGQQVLFQRCYAEYGYHDFSVGFTAPGPNAFVQCYSFMPTNFSGAVGGWATGVLFDKTTVDGGIISLAYRDVDGQGGGWSAANSLSWQSKAAQIHISAPPTTQNWAYGSLGQGYGNGQHELSRGFIKPESLFYAQLEARTGKKSKEEEKIFIYDTERNSAPTPTQAAKLSERAKLPDLIMDAWIDSMISKYPIHSDLMKAKKINETGFQILAKKTQNSPSISIKNGWIMRGNKVVSGKKSRTTMWRGTTRKSDLTHASPNLVRFVAGRTGRGFTDDLDTVVTDMICNNVVTMQSFPALWYERRRDDHARTRRANADVWAPFYEQPFGRSGEGEAFDRLSKYDLTKWNTWYWLRLKQFADKVDQKGLLYIQEHYLQHNIIEEGAHWADYPWRASNNINNTGFAENTAYAGDKRVFMAEEFYDTAHFVRRQLHRSYIRKSLDNFKGNTNIIHHLGVEYTGPLHFAAFWLDVISQWEKENNQNLMVMLPGTKDVQDAILADSKLSTIVDAIDVLQWHYRKDGSLYAPVGGQSIATRQYARINDVGESSFGQIYRTVHEFKTKYPEKAIIYSRGGVKFSEWAVFMGGGSLANLPGMQDSSFFQDAAKMGLPTIENVDSLQYVLGKKGIGYIIFCQSGKLKMNLHGDKDKYDLKWINPSTGEILKTKMKVSGLMVSFIKAPFDGAAVAWLTRNN
ncbi:MAG: pectate lyase [Segetibacter sp.]|nr:pectate lyase [Segetibacter sp.]